MIASTETPLSPVTFTKALTGGFIVLTIRGKTVPVLPLTMTQMIQLFENMREPPTATGEFNLANLPHLMRAVAVSIKPHFPGISLDELTEELTDSLALVDLVIITDSLFANTQPRIHIKEAGHG